MYIVTGVSRGLGLALAELLLKKGEVVCGVGRSHSIEHENFTFIKCDLSDPKAVDQMSIDLPEDNITLINNAGIIGEIGRISEQESWDLDSVLQVNTISPMELTKKIYNQLADKDKFGLVNISSGAANRSIPAWAAYCASKAALNRLSESFLIEERELGNNPKVYAISPGVIDTDMQVEIRSASENDFSEVKKFVELKNEGHLFSAEQSAEKILKILNQPYNDQVLFDVRDY